MTAGLTQTSECSEGPGVTTGAQNIEPGTCVSSGPLNQQVGVGAAKVWSRCERHGLVCLQVNDIAIKVDNASSIAGHLRYMDKKEILHKLDMLAVERQKFSFQPFITGPFSAINIIMSSMCNITLPTKA